MVQLGLTAGALWARLVGVVNSIDVLMPVYALAEWPLLQRAIASVFAQDHSAQTLWLLINGASAEERQRLAARLRTQALPQGHPTVLQLEVLEQAGITAALNRGLALSQAQWLARLDADDRMAPERLRLMLDHLHRCQQAGRPVPDVIGSAVAVLDARGEQPTGAVLRRPCSDAAIRRYLWLGNPLMHPSVMLRRALLAQVGGYRPSPSSEDLDLWLRLARLPGVTFANMPQPLTLYTLRPGSLSHQRDSFLHVARCRLRHCDTPVRALFHAPKIVSDLLRYVLRRLLGPSH
jgi:glycosyltransferase involved in cell wall biosynthesis